MAGKNPDFKRPRIVSALLGIGLVAQAALEAGLSLFLWQNGSDEATLTGAFARLAGERGISGSSVAEGYITLTYAVMVLGILTFVLLCFWLWRSVNNADEAGAHMNYEPGWAIGWWFVPFANLWKPFDMMCELYSASQNPRSWSVDRRPTLVIAWWLFNITAGVIGVIIRFSSMSGNADTGWLLSLLYAAGATRLILLLAVVLRVNSFQNRLQSRPGVEQVF